MKRLLLLFSAVLLLICCSCTPKTSSQQTDSADLSNLNSFESTAKIRYKDIEAQAVLNKNAPGEGKISFTSPELLNGLTMEMKSGLLDVDYKGMRFSVDPNSFPASAALKLLVSSIDSAAQKDGVRVQLEDTALVITGQSEAGEFELRFDRENGNALYLSIPEAEMEVEFINFTVS